MSQQLLVILSLILLVSCAGPTSPFGSSLVVPETNLVEKRSINNHLLVHSHFSNIKIESYPSNKIYHRPFVLKFKLISKDGPINKLKYDIVYNKNKLNRWWQTETIKYSEDKTTAFVEFPNTYLNPSLKNNIAFHFYLNDSKNPYIHDFAEPRCDLGFNREIREIPNFKKKRAYINPINDISKQYDLNSYLLASLVAQESSFNPKAVSWAKAIGLTQVTPLANLDIMKVKKDWTYDKRVSRLPYPLLKYKIYKGQITAKDDWRLDRDKSLEGGSVFMNKLQSYWSSPRNKKLLSKTFKEIPITDIVLASYNSGPSRVKNNIRKLKKDWLSSKQLNEARKYVKNIKSYCHHFQKTR